MAVRDILFDIAGEFATVDVDALARVDRFIGYAALELTPDAWGDRLDMATALLAAHKLTLASPTRSSGQAGPVLSEKVGDMAVTYASPTPTNAAMDPLAATSYGLQLIQLRSGLYFGGILL